MTAHQVKCIVVFMLTYLLLWAGHLTGQVYSSVAYLDAWAAQHPGRLWVIEGSSGRHTVRLRVNAGTKDEVESFSSSYRLEDSTTNALATAKSLDRFEH